MATIKDIAKSAGVSVSTVSKALNRRVDIGEETRRKILTIAKELNYVHGASINNSNNKKTENIGVIFCRESQPLSLNPFYSRVLEGIEAELAINNYNLVLHLLRDEKNVPLPKMLREHQVDGVILTGVFKEDFIRKLRKTGVNAVFIDPKIPIKDISQVLIDNEHGAFMATQYIISKGHTRIGFISGELDRLSFFQRYKGYKKALEYNNITFDEELVRSGDLEKGYNHTKKLLVLENRPTAIFSANDINAIYGYQAIKEANLRIPHDISIVGFDDIYLAKMSSPALTTMRVYKEEMGSIAVRKLLQIISKEIDKEITTMIPTRLVERESVRDLTE